MTTIGMHYDVIAGKEAEFESGFIGVIEHLKKVPGHVASRLFTDVASKGSYLIMSEWDTRQSFDSFIRSPEFKAVTSWGKAEILRGRPQHKVYQNG